MGPQFATILSVVAVIAGAQGVFLACLWLGRRRDQLLAWWAAALCALCAGCVLAVWRAMGGPLGTGVAGGGFIILSSGLTWQALRFFDGRPPVWLLLAGAPLLWAASVFAGGGIASQLAVNGAGALVCGFLGLSLRETWRGRREALPSRVLLAVALGVAGACILAQLAISVREDWIAAVRLQDAWGVWLTLAYGVAISMAAAMALGMSRERTALYRDVMSVLDPETGALRISAFLGPAARLVAAQLRQGGAVTFVKIQFDGEDPAEVEARLREVHERLMASAQAADISARVRPGAIALIMPGVTPDGAAAQLRRVLAETAPGRHGQRWRVRARAGIADSADVGLDLRALMLAAEAASDDAADGGPDGGDIFSDRVHVYSPQREPVRRAAGLWPAADAAAP